MPDLKPSHRAQTLADMKATIAAHVADDEGLCLGCRDNGEDEAYPCPPVVFASRAADLLARRIAGGPDWRACVMDTDLSRAVWQRPTRNNGSEGSYVEVAFVGDIVAMRNSDGPDGPILIYARREWEAFISGVRDGEFAS